MEKKNTVWIVENMWNSDDGPTVNIQVCVTKEAAAKTFAAMVADEVEFWRNDLGLPITDDMLKESGYYSYDHDTNKFTLCDETCYYGDLEITIEDGFFRMYDSMECRSIQVTLYTQTIVEQRAPRQS